MPAAVLILLPHLSGFGGPPRRFLRAKLRDRGHQVEELDRGHQVEELDRGHQVATVFAPRPAAV